MHNRATWARLVHATKMVKGNMRAFFIWNELFMSIDANPSEFSTDILVNGTVPAYAYKNIVATPPVFTHTVTYSEYAALTWVIRMGLLVD